MSKEGDVVPMKKLWENNFNVDKKKVTKSKKSPGLGRSIPVQVQDDTLTQQSSLPKKPDVSTMKYFNPSDPVAVQNTSVCLYEYTSTSSQTNYIESTQKLPVVSRKCVRPPTFKYHCRAATAPYPSSALIAKLGGLTLDRKSRSSVERCAHSNFSWVHSDVITNSKDAVRECAASSCSTGSVIAAPLFPDSTADMTKLILPEPSDKCIAMASKVNITSDSVQEKDSTCMPSCSHLSLQKRLRKTIDLAVQQVEPKCVCNKCNSMVKVSRSCSPFATSIGKSGLNGFERRCSLAQPNCDVNLEDLTSYMENYWMLPKKMSSMAEMMYT